MTEKELIQQYYIGFYGRPADSEGLEYWSDRVQEKGTGAVLEDFATSPEAEEFVFTDPESGQEYTDEVLVQNIYQNLFGRDADDQGLEFYTEKLESDEMTPISIVQNIMDGVRNEDENVLENKLEVADYFTQNAAGKDYGEEHIQQARSILEGRLTDISDASARARGLLDKLPEASNDSDQQESDNDSDSPDKPDDGSGEPGSGDAVETKDLAGTYELADNYTGTNTDGGSQESPDYQADDNTSVEGYMTINETGKGRQKFITEIDYSDQPVDYEGGTYITYTEFTILEMDDSEMTYEFKSWNDEDPDFDYDSTPDYTGEVEDEYEYDGETLLLVNEFSAETYEGEMETTSVSEWTKTSGETESQLVGLMGVQESDYQVETEPS